MFRTLCSAILAFLFLIPTVPAIEKVCGPAMQDAYLKQASAARTQRHAITSPTQGQLSKISWKKRTVYYSKIVLR